MYVFENNATAEQESMYRALSGKLENADQTLNTLLQRERIINGEESVFAGSNKITSVSGIGQTIAGYDSTAQKRIDSFSADMENILKYMEDVPNQYSGQSGDVENIRTKLQELKQASTPQAKLDIINSFKTDLDEIYIKTGISEGARSVSSERILSQLDGIANATDATQAEKDAVNFLKEYPELLRSSPKISDYNNLLADINARPTPLSPKVQALKTALEKGDTFAVNNLYFDEMFSSINFSGGLFGMATSFAFRGSIFQNNWHLFWKMLPLNAKPNF